MIAQGARRGLLVEAAVLAALLSHQPFPVRRAFGDAEAYASALGVFHARASPRDKASVVVANLAAFARQVVARARSSAFALAGA